MERLKWERYRINLIPSKRIAEIYSETWETNDSPYHRKFPMNNRKNRTEKFIVKISIDPIPYEEYIGITHHFDSRGLQSDDRFFTTKRKARRPDQKIMIKVKAKIAKDYPTEPRLVNDGKS